jgi:glycosyltransferase involved in cell wall biosynthesis
MTAVLGAWIARRQRAKLYLDIRDIFVDTIQDVIGGFKSRPIKLVSEVLERFALRQATKVNLVSPGFLGYFVQRYPAQSFSCFTNGVDDEFVRAGPRAPGPVPRHGGNGTITVLYAGNIGEGQGLHQILPTLAKRLDGQVRFQIVGDGGRRAELEAALRAAGCTNVAVLPPVPREQLPEMYRAADVLFLHLNDYPAFEKVLPSKLFEYAAMGKPVLAGVGGFAAEFVRAEIPNARVFCPCDVSGAMEAFKTLTLEEAPRDAFVRKYGRAAICQQMAEDVLSVMAHNP